MRKRTTRSLSLLLALVLAVSVMAIPVFAGNSVTDQMAANSAAWWVAYNAGDTATCNALHEANVALANQAAGSGGTASYNSSGGNWTITTGSGETIKSTGSSSGKNTTISYTTTTSGGHISQSSSSSYMDDSISAYLSNGGSRQGLIDSYNNAADTVSSGNGYKERAQTLNADSEIALAKALFGLSDQEAKQLERELEESKAAYVQARDVYEAALRSGDGAQAAAAKAQMDAAHAQAEETRGKYGYSGDSSAYSDGGFFYGGDLSTPNSTPSYTTPSGNNPTPGPTPNPPSLVPVYQITANASEGGSITPSGTTNVRKGASQSYTIVPDEGYSIRSVIVDGIDRGVISNYTFSNVTGTHSISASFTADGEIEIRSINLTDAYGASVDAGAGGKSIKSGYGIFSSIPISVSGMTELELSVTYDFGQGSKTITMEETAANVFQFPLNTASPARARCVYIPVETLDGSYTLTYTLKAKDINGAELTDSKTATVSVLGDMYSDDFTGNS